MVSLVSGEASFVPTLHLDPTLEVPVEAECQTCCPIKAIVKKIFCCCASNCCNKTETHDTIIYCKSDGRCVPFDYSKSENPREDYRKTAERIKMSISQDTRLSVIVRETGVDLDEKVANAEPLKLKEVKKLQRAKSAI